MQVTINSKNYELEKNIREAFDLTEVESKMTDYFDNFDYVVGDWAYGKLRLKGFYNEKNKQCKDFNNIKYLEKYIKNNCAYNCKYFVLKSIVKNN